MPQVVMQGQVNLAALSVPDIIVQIIPPQLLINGVPSNIVGFVGTASWGPTNVPVIVGGYQNGVAQFCNPNPRQYDLMTAVWAACQQGAQAFRCVRVTDGTDAAASVVVQSNCLTVTSLYTGSGGNGGSAGGIGLTIQNGSMPSSMTAVVTFGGQVPEVFPNITQGIVDFEVTAGTFTECPTAITLGAPTQSNGVQAVAAPVLNVTGTPTIAGAGTGFAVDDEVTLSNGVTIKVLTESAGAIETVSVVNAGTVLAGLEAPTNPVAQTSTTGGGTGATFNLTWGLGQPTLVTGGQGYISVPTATIVGGEGTGASLTAVISYWQNIANAINNGVSGLRSASQRVMASVGGGTQTPTLASYPLTGGTDGANPAAIGSQGAPALIGEDSIPRTGMYALRNSYVSMGVLVDCADSTTWSEQASFGLSEGIYMIVTGPAGDTITNAATVLADSGAGCFQLKVMFGDWITINDPITGVQRMISPQSFVAGFMGNQDPSQTPMNKQMLGIVGTQKSQTGIQYTSADLQALATAGIDVICNPNPGGNYFGLRLGINSSGNQAEWGDNYTRMTFFIAETIDSGCGMYVGQLQTAQQRYEAQATLSAFFAELENLGMIGTPDGSPCYEVQINDGNNPFNMVALGYEFAYCAVTYLSVIRYFIIDLQGGQTVQISDTLPTPGAVNVGNQAPTVG